MVPTRLIAPLGVASAAIVLVGCFAILMLGTVTKPANAFASPGFEAPEFGLRDAGGELVTLSGLRGHVVALCVAPNASTEDDLLGRLMPYFMPFEGEITFEPLGVFGSEPVDDAYFDGQITPFTALLDDTHDIARRYGVENEPTLFLIDPTGKIIVRRSLDDSYESWQNAVREAIADSR